MNISLDFGNHMSTYYMPVTVAEELQVMFTVYDMAEHVVNRGKRLDWVDIASQLYLDVTRPDVDNAVDFLDNLATALVNEQAH